MRRIESLDYLRGLMAVSVMAYHYVSWAASDPGASTLLGRLGIYAVSIFYILSGLSLSLVYQGRINSLEDVRGFIVKRVFRIFPVFWIAVTAGVAMRVASAVLGGRAVELRWVTLGLNYTLLFGFVSPGAYLTTGAWSIGNEMVFYALFAGMLFIACYWRGMIEACFAFSLILAGWLHLTGSMRAVR